MHSTAPERIKAHTLTPDLLTPAEAADYLRTTESTLAQMRYKGNGPLFTSLGSRKILYRRSDINAYLAGNLRAGGAA